MVIITISGNAAIVNPRLEADSVDLPLRFLRPFLGARILKTGIAVFLALIAFSPIGDQFMIMAAVGAMLAIQPSINQTKQTFIQQQLGNLFGGLVGATIGYWLGSSAVTMALAVVVVLGILSRFQFTEAASFGVIVVLFVMDRPDHDFVLFTLIRIVAISGGMAIGYAVNRFIRPPDFTNKLREELYAVGESVDALVEHLIDSLGKPDHYRKEEIKSEETAILKRLETVRRLIELSHETNGPDRRKSMEKAISTMFVWTERLMDIHLVVLRIGGLPASLEREITADLLRAAATYRKVGMTSALFGNQSNAESRNEFTKALLLLDDLVNQWVKDPATRQVGMALHVVAMSIRDMGNRLEALQRMKSN